MLKMDTTKEEAELISQIVTRVIDYCTSHGGYCGPDRLTLEIDLTVCHLNGCPLRLKELATANVADLEHDVMGIDAHLNRSTGRLEHCFEPRYAEKVIHISVENPAEKTI